MTDKIDELEKAANEYCIGSSYSDAMKKSAFKAGAKWQMQQMMKNAIAGTVNEPECLWWRIISEDLEGKFVVENNLHDGDEVKLIVIKENDYGQED